MVVLLVMTLPKRLPRLLNLIRRDFPFIVYISVFAPCFARELAQVQGSITRAIAANVALESVWQELDFVIDVCSRITRLTS